MSELENNNPLFRAMARLGDLVVFSVLWLLCCLPVVTAGASTLAQRIPEGVQTGLETGRRNLAAHAGAAGFAGVGCQRRRAVPGAVGRAVDPARCG